MGKRRSKNKKKTCFFKRKPLSPDALAETLANESTGEPKPVQRFEDMDLNQKLLRGVKAYPLKVPSFCQQRIIVPCIDGRDVICQAQSGMGKTAAFCIAVLQRINVPRKFCQSLVLAPTRELALQIYQVFLDLGRFMSVECACCVGGTRAGPDQRKVQSSHIVVGTVGRLSSLMKKGYLDGNKLDMFVIDEADKMIMDPSFRNIMRDIIGSVSPTAQVIVSSATMPCEALEQVEAIMYNPLKILVKSEQLTLDGIQQFYINVGEDQHKVLTLNELYPLITHVFGLLFCNTRAMAQKLIGRLKQRGHGTAAVMVGTMGQGRRNKTLDSFRGGETRLLISSDLLGRGVDVDHVKLVLNYDLPNAKEDYIHRVGRAGRYGKKGIAITLITDDQEEDLQELEAFYNTSIKPLPRSIHQLFSDLK